SGELPAVRFHLDARRAPPRSRLGRATGLAVQSRFGMPLTRSDAPATAGWSRAIKLYLTLGTVAFVAVALALTALGQPPVPVAVDPTSGLPVPPRHLPLDRSGDWFSIAWAAASLPTA